MISTMAMKRVQVKRATWMMVKNEASIVKLENRTIVPLPMGTSVTHQRRGHQLKAMALEISIAPVRGREVSGTTEIQPVLNARRVDLNQF